jgi:pSer/pThr/pTyr-binding forkhead associated (FHA) protein
MLRIGKNPTNDLVIKDRAAEDFHCILYISNNELIVEDLKSHYGTLVNGTKISHAILYPGDELQIGFTRIEWQKLMPALQAIGDTSDAESFLQAQDLNLEIRDDSDFQSTNEVCIPSDYTIDSTPELIEKALNLSIIKELDYPVTIQNEIIEVSEEQQPQSTLDVAVANSENGFTEQNSSEDFNNQKVELEKQNPVTRVKVTDPYKKYYFILVLMIAIMVISGIVIAAITG